jgi:hypothetical protein
LIQPGISYIDVRAARVTLGVDCTASKKDIRRAFLAKSFDVHPDRSHHLPPSKRKKLEARFIVLLKAYDVLRKYDSPLQREKMAYKVSLGKVRNPNRWALMVLPLLFLVMNCSAQAANVLLMWAANTEPDLASYKAFYGLTPRNYGTEVQVGKTQTNLIISGLNIGSTYYFALKAVDTLGLESDFSQEVFVTITANPPPSGQVISLGAPFDRQLKLTRRVGNSSKQLPLTVNKDDCVTFNGVKVPGGLNCP